MESIAQKNKKIMIIDDSEVMLEMTRQVLGDIYDVYTFASSPDAILQMRSIAPNLVLLDYEMPNLNGLQIIRWMNENEFVNKIPVIFLTSYQDVKFELEAFRLGAVDYIHKPFAPALLKKRIELHLEHAERQSFLADNNNELMRQLDEKTKIIKELQYAIVFTLSDLVEMRDNSTGEHITRTTEYYRLLLDYIDKNGIYTDLMKNVDHDLILEAAQLHDIGKVAIPDCILLKPARLTEKEFDVMKTHTLIGYNALVKAMRLTHDREFLNIAAVVALTHHERWDGTGYPRKLEGDAIPLVGRIMAIVDVYDAIISVRPYKNAMSHEEALREIVSSSGTHFDPKLVDALLHVQQEFKFVSEH